MPVRPLVTNAKNFKPAFERQKFRPKIKFTQLIVDFNHSYSSIGDNIEILRRCNEINAKYRLRVINV